MIVSLEQRETLARAAFWGSRPGLMALLEEHDGYQMDGVWWPANAMTLARAIELVRGLPEETLEELAALGLL